MKEYVINSLGELRFSPKVKYIKNGQFSDNSGIRTVFISKEIVEIGIEAFSNCSNIRKVVFDRPSSLKIIREGAFGGCVSLEEISFPVSLEVIQEEAFSGCSSLRKIYLPIRVTFVGKRTFRGCISIESIIISSEKTVLDDGCFMSCRDVKQFTYGDKKYKTLPNWKGFSLVLREVKYKNFLFVKIFLFDGSENNKRLFGTMGYNCIAPFPSRIGEGETVRKAYQDWEFLKRRNELLEEVHNITIDSRVSIRDYRLISGSCYFGTKNFCDNFGFTEKMTVPVKWVIQRIRFFVGDPYCKRFVRYFEEKWPFEKLKDDSLVYQD